MNAIVIRKGRPTDVPAVMELVRELAVYEKAAHEVSNTESRMLADGFSENPAFGLFIAERERQIIGIAIHFVRYSTWKGKMLYLEDIVVRQEMRGQGAGAALFEACMQHCIDAGYAGMSWQVLDWNEPALNFYSKYNAQFDNEWVNGKIMREQMLPLLNKQ